MASTGQHPAAVKAPMCVRADERWDGQDAVNFRDLCRETFGIDALCDGGDRCPLICVPKVP